MTSPMLWYLNRGTGVVLLVLFTLTTVLGMLSTGRAFSPLWPRFVTQGLHRSLAGLSSVLLLAHVTTAVLDEYVDIRWWEAFVPFAGSYEPLALGLGTLSLDIVVVVVVTSLLRHRIPERAWRAVHLSTYGMWALSVGHGLTIGTDSGQSWSLLLTLCCVGLVALAGTARVATYLRHREVVA